MQVCLVNGRGSRKSGAPVVKGAATLFKQRKGGGASYAAIKAAAAPVKSIYERELQNDDCL